MSIQFPASELPGLEFSSKDLVDVKFQVTINNEALHTILVQVVKTLHKVVKKTGELDEAIQGVAKDLIDTRADLEFRIRDVQRTVNEQIAALQKDVNAQLAHMREESKQDRAFLHASIKKINEDVERAKEELEQQVRDIRDAAAAMEARLTKGVDDIQKEMRALSSSVAERFQSQQLEIDLLKEEGDLIFAVFDVTKQQVRATETREKRVRLLHSTPAFAALIEEMTAQAQQVEAKLLGVQSNVDGVKRDVVTRVTMTEFEEFKRSVRQDDLRKQVTTNRENIDRLFEGQTLIEKNAHLLDQKKADTTLLIDLQRAISQLDAKLMEQLSKEEQDKMEDLLDKLAELQNGLEKMDRRKVGRAEFNKLTKNVKAGGMGMGGGNTDDLMMGGGAPLSISGDAAFLRYRCLSCNKPAGKVTDDTMRRPMQQFPPSPVLVTPTRHNAKVQNYFEWVGNGTPPPGAGQPPPVIDLEDSVSSATPAKTTPSPAGKKVGTRPTSATIARQK